MKDINRFILDTRKAWKKSRWRKTIARDYKRFNKLLESFK